MSLTGHLTWAGSPVRAFFEQQLPNTRGVLADLRATDPHTGAALVLPEQADGYPWATVGTAFDYRVRYLLAHTPAGRLVAVAGASFVSEMLGGDRLPQAFVELAELIDTLPAATRDQPLPEEQETTWARVCYVLALYEQCYRAGPDPSWPIVALGLDAPVEAAALALCPDHVAHDFAALTGLLIAIRPPFLDATDLTLNPTFAGSAALGGADADLIAGGTLSDLKTKKMGRPGRADLWQLLGYTLADHDDHHHVKAVALYYSRQGRYLRWELPDLLGRLAGRPVGLDHLRKQFVAVLDQVPDALKLRVTAAIPVPREPAQPPRLVDTNLTFRPPAAGNGKWHARWGDVFPAGEGDDDEAGPACGARTALATGPDVITPAVGTHHDDVDQRICRRCVAYTDTYYEAWRAGHYDRPAAVRRELPFRRLVTGHKWHLTFKDLRKITGLGFSDEDAASCGASAAVDPNTETLTPTLGQRPGEVDPRICRRCLTNALWAPYQPTEGPPQPRSPVTRATARRM